MGACGRTWLWYLLAFNGGLMQRLLGLEEYLMVFGVKLQFTSLSFSIMSNGVQGIGIGIVSVSQTVLAMVLYG